MSIKDKIGYFLLTGVCPLVLLIHISIWTYWAYVMPTTLHNVLLFTVALIAFSVLAICFVVMFKNAERTREARVREERVREERAREARVREERAREAERAWSSIQASITGLTRRQTTERETEREIEQRIAYWANELRMESMSESHRSYFMSARPIVVSTQKSRGTSEPVSTKVSTTEPTPKKIANPIFESEISD